MHKNCRRWRALSAAFLPLLLTGCQLFPQEEEFPAAPVIQQYEAAEYKQTTVIRGDLLLTESVPCRYMPTKKESLSFPLGGEYIEGVYVTEGQQVKAGDLLAELMQDDLEGQIESYEYQLQVLALQNDHILENRELELKRLDALYPVIEWRDHSYTEAKADIDEKYQSQIQDNEDSQYIEGLHLEELKEELNKRQLVAGFDGTITYVRVVKEGQQSVEDQVMITLADMSTTAFTVSGEKAAYFPVGTEVVITKGKSEYMAVSVEASELGPAEVSEDAEPIAYLRLMQPDPTLENGDTGKVEITLDSRLNTLYVDKETIKTADGRQFVYISNEEGLKVMQDVTVGMESGNYIEILSGLEEGDSVILE